MSQAVIYDTDPGIDDAIALYLALASPEIKVVGVTTVFGNVHTEVATRNARILLDIAGRPDIPVAAGASAPMAMAYRGPVAFVHGHNGLGDVDLPEPSRDPIGLPAPEFIWQTCSAQPGEITLLAVGPLTNLALALQEYPELPALVKRVVIMGGNAYTHGNASPAAEANILNDPEAADMVFGADWDVTMVGLDVTNHVVMTDDLIASLSRSEQTTARHLTAMIGFYRQFNIDVLGHTGIRLHDPAAAAYLFAPDLFTTVDAPIRVETESFSRGKTWPNEGNHDPGLMEPWLGRSPVHICTDVQGRALAELIVDRLV